MLGVPSVAYWLTGCGLVGNGCFVLSTHADLAAGLESKGGPLLTIAQRATAKKTWPNPDRETRMTEFLVD